MCNAVEGMIGILGARRGSLAQIAAHTARSRRRVGGVFGGLIEFVHAVLAPVLREVILGAERLEDVP